MKFLRLLLFPFSIIYGIVIIFRNILFDRGFLPVKEYPLPVVSIGNITVGGTGKTPLTEWVIRLFVEKYHVALLSRGYKRKTKGPLLANDKSTSETIGDEPLQIYNKFKGIMVAVAEKRVEGFQKLLSASNPPDIIVMDDAYQHRYVKPGLSILVMDYNRPLWKDCMLPTGNLREPKQGKKRANVVLVSKCPANMDKEAQSNIIKKLNLQPDQSVYFSTIGYQHPILLFCKNIFISAEDLLLCNVLLVTGIATPEPLVKYLTEKVKSIKMVQYPDHHQYSIEDVDSIRTKFESLKEQNKIILTTEKDSVRLAGLVKNDEYLSSAIYYIPIEIEILNGKENELRDKLTTYVRQIKGDC